MTKLAMPDVLALPDMLRAATATQAEQTAVSRGSERLSFRQLSERSEQIGRYLRQRGVQADQPVGIFMEPSVDLMTSVWAVLQAGAPYLPLSPEYPDERLGYMVSDSGANVILAEQSLVSRLTVLVPAKTTIITLDDATGHPDYADRYSSAALPSVTGNQLAYVIYTSGSTGRPKGIGIEHHSIVSQMRWLAAAQSLNRGSTVLQKTPLSFDAAQWEILAPACGSRVVMSDPGAYRDPSRLIDLVVANDITTFQGVPTMLQALLDSGQLSRCTSLTRVFSGGEALPKTLAIELLDALPHCELVNLYGPSECTINASALIVDRDTVQQGPGTVSVGRPAGDVQFYILDGSRAAVTDGQSGELYIAGPQLARGYLNRPDLTAERFLVNPFAIDPAFGRMYRTGDLARWNADGTVQFLGRTDSQVKLRGFRVELDEIKVAIEHRDWIKRAAVLVREDPRFGANLVAFVELDPRRAALMDQGNHGAHHQSKQSKVQLRAQLANLGIRDEPGLPAVELPGQSPSTRQRRLVFARKSYRFYEGDDVSRGAIVDLLADQIQQRSVPRSPETLTRFELGTLLRHFGQFASTARLLPKYGYASPGSLYGTQLYLELSGIAGLGPGYYYYHPIKHQLHLIGPASAGRSRMRVHLIGRRSAVEAVYRNNVREVLQLEAGHLVGLFDTVLPDFGLQINPGPMIPTVGAALQCSQQDYYLASYDVESSATPRVQTPVEVYVQANPGRIADLAGGQYRYAAGDLLEVSGELIESQHVIAINQEVFRRASFGISMISRSAETWLRYVDLGRTLQRLQTNDLNLGLMSSGYSSETGNDLPSATRIIQIAGLEPSVASYFAVGGRVSAGQRLSEGMKEDAVHMRGPAEIIKDELADCLPHYMVPNRVRVLDSFPVTPNGKIDHHALRTLDEAAFDDATAPVIAPRTATEEAIAALWQKVLSSSRASIRDDFFAAGGHSLSAVRLVGEINGELGSSLPLQVLFESPTIAELARRVDREPAVSLSRLVRLGGQDGPRSNFFWPGLGGYPMSLRLLASRFQLDGPCFGVQAHGANEGETAYPSFEEMVEKDLDLIRQIQPVGPYRLWGYSFGARVAFEVAYQLERHGQQVEGLVLLAPGKPRLHAGRVGDARSAESRAGDGDIRASFLDITFVSILYSVFAGSIDPTGVAACLAATRDEDTFIDFVCGRFEHVERSFVHRITGVVRQTFLFEYASQELAERVIAAPITVLRANGDQESFIDSGLLPAGSALTVIQLVSDHYGLLHEPGVDEVVSAIQSARLTRKASTVPHVNIKHLPNDLDANQISTLVDAITSAIQTAFSVDEGAVSIALESVDREVWNDRVYLPEIVEGNRNLIKVPNY